jgi:putative transposase
MGQSYTFLRYHVIVGTKDRRPLITPAIRTRLYDYIGGILKNENGRLLAAGGTANHTHLLISTHPQTSIAEIMRLVKTNSSKWVHATFPDQGDFAWQTGYGAFTVSHSTIEQVKRYIADQETHHRRVSFEEEFTAFLQRHGITYDERYLWT